MNENFCFSLDSFTVCKSHTKRYIFCSNELNFNWKFIIHEEKKRKKIKIQHTQSDVLCSWLWSPSVFEDSQNSLQKGSSDTGNCCSILSFISSNDSGRGCTNTMPLTFQLANFHFKRTSTLTRLAPSRMSWHVIKLHSSPSLRFESFSFLSTFTKYRLTQKVL